MLMKKYSFLFIFLLLAGAMISCTPPEEDVHPKRPSQRSENLKRYVSKAQNLRAQALARSKPLVTKPLLNESALDIFLPVSQDSRISSYLLAYQKELGNSVRTASAERVAEEAGALLTKFRNDVVTAARAAQTPQDLKEKVTALNGEYSALLTKLTQEEDDLSWNVPDKKMLVSSQRMLEASSKMLYGDILRDYGLLCAQKAAPILKKAGDDSCLVLSSAPTTEDVEEELRRVAHEADVAFNDVLKKYGNPSVNFNQEDLTKLLQQASANYTELEQQLEKLYGLEAVTQGRIIFEKYQNGLKEIFSKSGRLLTKKEQLEGLEEFFREEFISLQVRLNSDFERRAIAKRLATSMD